MRSPMQKNDAARTAHGARQVVEKSIPLLDCRFYVSGRDGIFVSDLTDFPPGLDRVTGVKFLSPKPKKGEGEVFSFDYETRREEDIMRILYGTGNPAKLASMQKRLSDLGIELIGLKDVAGKVPDIVEDGTTPLENARKKALGYYRAFGIPVFSCDSGLYLDGVTDEEQPGVHVRTVSGKYLTDEEMLLHYSSLARKYGNLTARYRNAICLVLGEGEVYEAMEESMASEPFRITAVPHEKRKAGFPLDSLSVDIKTGKYYYDLAEERLDQVAVEDGFREFFRRYLCGGIQG